MRYENQRFTDWRDFDSGRVYQDEEFIRCHFDNCTPSAASHPRLRSTYRHMLFKDCVVSAMGVYAAAIEDVVVDNLRTGSDGQFLLQVFGAVFKHVTLRGKIGDVMITSFLGLSKTPSQRRLFEVANAEYYRHVDWALDIRDAEFLDCDIRSGVPVGLIRRDPETQVIVTRAKALEGRWRHLDLSGTPWAVSLEWLLGSEDEAVVLVAPKQNRRFRQDLAGLDLLRCEGVAEPD